MANANKTTNRKTCLHPNIRATYCGGQVDKYECSDCGVTYHSVCGHWAVSDRPKVKL